MSLSGLLTEGLFNLFKIKPKMSEHVMAMNHFGLNYTTVLNVIALVVAISVYLIYKNGSKENSEFAKDLVCGMQVRIADAPAQTTFEGKTYYFCMPGCMETFIATPQKYL